MILRPGDTTIFVRDNGVPYRRPDRDEFPDTTEGDIAYLRAWYAYKDEIVNDANRAFHDAFMKAMKKKT